MVRGRLTARAQALLIVAAGLCGCVPELIRDGVSEPDGVENTDTGTSDAVDEASSDAVDDT